MGSFNYNCDGQISMFDIIPNQSPKYPPVINELYIDLKDIFQESLEEVEYNIWSHVPYLGYRLCTNIDVLKSNYDSACNDIKMLTEKYKKFNLEVSALQGPCINDWDNKVSIMISTLWKDKERAKKG